MTRHVSGPFEVKIAPDATGGDPAIGRMTLDKQFHGALDATSKGQMLAARTAIETSAGYVALECVRGSLEGRAGTFVLIHRGIMTRAGQELSVTVVPDSGTGALVGLSGSMKILVAADGKHSYDLEYALP